MKEYRRVLNFFYKDNQYVMFLDNNNKRFFLKTDNTGNLYYPTIEEIIILFNYFSSIPNVMNAHNDSKKKNRHFIPKAIIGGVTVTLGLTFVSGISENYKSQLRVSQLQNNEAAQSSATIDIANYISTADESNSNDDLVVDTYRESQYSNNIYIYDMNYLNKVLDYKTVDFEEIKDTINKNSGISDNYKKILIDYCSKVVNKYPTADLRNFYENLKTLEVVECSKSDLVQHTLSIDSYGCYVSTENKIYVLKDQEYKKGTWEYQVLYHEFSHCLRNGAWEKDGKKVWVRPGGDNFDGVIATESLNSLFAVSLFDYDEKDIAYQLQSNYYGVMLDCLDNYDLSDYVNHSLGYFAKKLDDYNADENYSTIILNLIQMQYDEFHGNDVKVPQSEYYPIYDYISDMYYKKYVTKDSTYEDINKLTDKLVNEITYDVPAGYNIDTNHIYNYMDNYCQSRGIVSQSKHK